MKICCCCKQKLPSTPEFFHRWVFSKDGLRNRCKRCRKLYDKISFQAKCNRKQWRKKYRQTLNGKAEAKRSVQKARLKFPEKKKAREIVAYAIKTGRLKRSIFCEFCGLPKNTEGHHEDYKLPLKVNWVCRDCHIKIDKGI